MAQYDAPALRNRTRAAIEAFELALRNIGEDASRACPDHFDADMWSSEVKTYVEDFMHPTGSFLGLIDDADDKLSEAEYADGLEPGQSYTPNYRPLFPYPAAE